MTSLANNYFHDLLDYTTAHTKNDEDAIKMERELQFRLANFFQDNPTPTLLFSQKYSGDVNNNLQKEPLGGPINPLRAGPNNIPTSGYCPDEFPFWNFAEKEHKKENKQDHGTNNDEEIENQNDLVEHFTNENFVDTQIKENFDGSTVIPIIIGVLVIIIVLLGLFFILKKSPKIPPLSTETPGNLFGRFR